MASILKLPQQLRKKRMKTIHFGTKRIAAIAMTRMDYIEYRGWKLPSEEDGTDAGYLVEYVDGGAPNHPDHKSYISWSPSGLFDQAYQENGNLSFGHAIEAMKLGHKVARAGWNGKGMFVFLVSGSTFTVNREPLLSILGEGTEVKYMPHIDIKNVDGSISTWVPSIGDCLANDWQIVT
jgi:hypothetical protein